MQRLTYLLEMAQLIVINKVIDMGKSEIRQGLLNRRGELSAADVKDMSGAIVSCVQSLAKWQDAQEVLLYWPLKNEVDVRPLLMNPGSWISELCGRRRIFCTDHLE